MKRVDLHPEDLIDRERLGVLSPEERDRLETHRAECTACAFERRVSSDVAGALAPREEDRAILGRVLAGAALTVPRPTRSRGSWWQRAAVAAFLLLVASGSAAALWSALGGGRGSGDRPSGAPPAVRIPAFRPPLRAGKAGRALEEPASSDSELPAREPAPRRGSPAATVDGRALPPEVSETEATPEPTAAELFSAANRVRRAGESAEAARTYRELQRRFPASREAVASRVTLGRLRLDRLGDPAGALADFDRYLAVQPRGTLAVEARVGRAIALMRLGRGREERAAWEEILVRHPSSVHAARARQRLDALR